MMHAGRAAGLAEFGHPARSCGFGGHGTNALAALVVAIRIAARADRLRFCRWNARDEQDRDQQERLRDQRDEAEREEREAGDHVAEPHAPLEEVVLLEDRSVENRSILDVTKREKQKRSLVGAVIVEKCAG